VWRDILLQDSTQLLIEALSLFGAEGRSRSRVNSVSLAALAPARAHGSIVLEPS
jgi:hypothetical protein